MQIIVNPPRDAWRELCVRNIPDDSEIEKTVAEIIENVKTDGDKALLEYARRFDRFKGDSLIVDEDEIGERAALVAPEVADAIRAAARNIETFHKAQHPMPVEVETLEGVRCLQRGVPIEKVGLYIPGGRAPLFSTVLMLAIPARIAGCREVVLCTPDNGETGIAPEILFAARL